MQRFQVSYFLHPQRCDIEQLLDAARRADALGVHALWVWDHLFPLDGPPDGPTFECCTLLAAMTRETRNARLGALVCSNTYRNPELLAYMTGTLDHLSAGRAILGIGAGWHRREHDDYGFEFGDATWRLRQLDTALSRIRRRLAALRPASARRIPIMIGGGGEKVTLKLVASHADMWNGEGEPATWERKNRVLDRWCAVVGRDPAEIERTCIVPAHLLDDADAFVDAGATHLIVDGDAPFDLGPVERLLDHARYTAP